MARKEVKSKEVKSKEVKHSVKSENLFICNLVAKGISLREARKRYANVAGAEESDEKSEDK